MFYVNLDIETASRYDLERFIAYTNTNHDILDSYFLQALKKVPFTGETAITTEEGRPDLLANTIYGNPNYWWILMYYNSLVDPSELISGMVIKYPAISDLESIYFTLMAKSL